MTEMAEFMYELRVPKERIAVLIGRKGETKKEVEEQTKTKLEIDSKEGDVILTGKDALGLYSARQVVRAVGRGFNPNTAMLLLKQDMVFEVIDISEYVKSKETLVRLKGRVIGEDGKSRRLLEELTECYICIYGKTVSIIGENEGVINARHAVELLLEGSKHANVYRWLEKKRREMKKRRIVEME